MELIQNVANIKANGHYSQAVVHNGLVFVSGQFSVDPQTGERLFGSIGEETTRILQNIDLILKQSGSNKSKILKATAYVDSMEKWGEVNTAYAAFFGEHLPARSIVNAKELHFGFQVEIEVIAAV